jgi:hypothetical protein
MACLVGCNSLLCPSTDGPRIEITHLPGWLSDENLEGTVRRAPDGSHIVAYLHVEGAGWWTKPRSVAPSTPLRGDGSFSVDVTTGGVDSQADAYCLALLPMGCEPIVLEGADEVPPEITEMAIAVCHVTRAPDPSVERPILTLENRIIQFAGREWGVKESNHPVGPGDNHFSASESDVWVDDEGLHLTLHERDGIWQCTEVVLLESLGYGTCVFQTDSRADDLDPSVVAGLFTWDTHADWRPGGSANTWPFREIDIEFSRWGDADDPAAAHFAIQPWHVEGNHQRWALPDQSRGTALTTMWTWAPGRIDFLALRGHHTADSFSEDDVIAEWTYTQDPGRDHWVPDEGRERVRINLWLNTTALGGEGPNRPSDGQPVELVIRDFQWHPL